MDKLNLSQLGEKLMTSGAQMGRMMSVKMKEVKEMLQAPTPESKMVEDATSETLTDPNWGTNLRICSMINSNQLNGSEVVKAIKRRFSHKNPLVHSLTLDLLDATAMNCDKVFSEIASEKLLDEMLAKLIDNPQADPNIRRRAFQLIRAWGQSQDLAYLPVFRQTYMSLQERVEPLVDVGGGSSPRVPHTLESYMQQQGLDPPSSYPVPEAGLVSMDDLAFSSGHQHMSTEEKKELLVVARNSLELLSSIINSDAEPKTLKEDLTLSLLDKCKQSLSIIKGIAESTTDDEETLFEALYLNDELQQIVSKYEELEAAQRPVAQEPPPNADTAKYDAEAVQNPSELPKRFEEDESEEFEAGQDLERKLARKSNGVEANANNDHHVETKILDEAEEKGNGESSLKSNRE